MTRLSKISYEEQIVQRGETIFENCSTIQWVIFLCVFSIILFKVQVLNFYTRGTRLGLK